MRILLSDGSGLRARQVATVLGRRGHRVEAISSDPFALGWRSLIEEAERT